MQDPRDYTQQINVVIDHINTHLDQNLDVKSLAGLTHLSPFHFHRIFSDAMGEPLAKYVMRKRLELAAIYLRHDVYKPIAEIAADTGFHSSNVFCRNFKRHFGMTAVEYRRKMEQQESKNHPSERIPQAAYLSQGPSYTSGQRQVRGIPAAVPSCLPESPARLYRFLSRDYAAYAQQVTVQVMF